MDFAIADLEKNKKALAEKQALFLAPLAAEFSLSD